MKKILLSLVVPFILALSFVPSLALAQCDSPSDPLGVGCGAASGLGSTDIRFIVARIIEASLGILGMLAIVLIVYAGYTWMTAAGNEDKVETAKKTLYAAVIGLVIILSAYAATDFVLRQLYRATTGSTYPITG